ncbi:probable ornithine carbamoyltransferase precursor [Sporisorium reilianum SRZ2]|uniref:ornithine carbamoyltransferase n=1 Tax=Sporisorium reilianum (strain SRZ2) TaxID=999809 RepID=E7A319_SPORE|nr:probable ornithine carbamoyltransferase precursor [Sporisorium reilianum SRZ2]
MTGRQAATALLRNTAQPAVRRLASTSSTTTAQRAPPHLLTLADLSPAQIGSVLESAIEFKSAFRATSLALPESSRKQLAAGESPIVQSLKNKSIAIMFSKRSTRTRVASETSVASLGGTGLFLAPSDIQLGVNESLYDTAKVVSSMVDGIMARVGGHDEVELLSKHSSVPVINALSARYHPTQILADLQTMLEIYAPSSSPTDLTSLAGLKVAWVGDSNNILNDMLVAYPRLGIHLAVATPKGAAYQRDDLVWGTMQDGLSALSKAGTSPVALGQVSWTNDPSEAVRDADIIVTDTWISMGDEAQKDQRLRDFKGFQVTEQMAKLGGAKPDWKFMHCLPRKGDEVDDEVFYSQRSVVFPEAENRKWTIMSLFDRMFGRWEL